MGHKKLVNADPSLDYPAFLKKAKAAKNADLPIQIIEMSANGSEKKLEELVKSQSVHEIVDNYNEQYAELLLSKNAQLYRANYSVQVASIKDMLIDHYRQRPAWKVGCWVFYPWSGRLVHVLTKEEFEDLRTIRNRDLITAKEQKKLFEFEAACFGMSVGSANALALAISGISRRIKLIDGAALSGSNLNRIMTGVESVGLKKAEVISQKIYEMNPYSQVHTYDKVSADNISAIFDKPWPIHLAIDEIDDLEMKIQIRLEARSRHIPVLMASELEDTVVLDVERFDLEPNRPIFHNLIPDIESIAKNSVENHREWMKLAVKILDPANMPIKLQKSLLKIGTTIVTHPQLGSTVMMTGGVLAFAAKNIALGQPIESGRYVISLEHVFLADRKTRAHRRKHKKHTKMINKALESM